MREKQMQAQIREVTGKGKLNEFRRKGMIPGILYGKNHENTNIFIEKSELRKILHSDTGTHSIINLKLDDKDVGKVILRELQQDPIDYKIYHVDIQYIDMNTPLTLTLPLEIEGSAKGVKEGGILEQSLREVDIKCLPSDIPDHIRVNVDDLAIGDSVHIKDLELENVEILQQEDALIVHVIPPMMISLGEEEEEGEEGLEVEGEEDAEETEE